MEHHQPALGSDSAARDHLELAIRIARDAGQLLDGRKAEARTTRTAIGRDIKIEGDYLLDGYILDRLRAETPFPIVSEESGGELGTAESWIVDPLDGSFNFARNLPFAAISIALWRGPSPVLGVVHDFARNECFSGLVGAGAWLNDQPIHPSRVADRAQAVLCTGVPVRNAFDSGASQAFADRIREFKKTRLLGSAALMLSYVACGRADLYREDSIALWDIAAGVAIVQAAGGSIGWREGREQYVLDVEASNGLLAISNEEGLLPR